MVGIKGSKLLCELAVQMATKLLKRATPLWSRPSQSPGWLKTLVSHLGPILESTSKCKSLPCRVATSLCLPPISGHSLPHGFEVCKMLFHT